MWWATEASFVYCGRSRHSLQQRKKVTKLSLYVMDGHLEFPIQSLPIQSSRLTRFRHFNWLFFAFDKSNNKNTLKSEKNKLGNVDRTHGSTAIMKLLLIDRTEGYSILPTNVNKILYCCQYSYGLRMHKKDWVENERCICPPSICLLRPTLISFLLSLSLSIFCSAPMCP